MAKIQTTAEVSGTAIEDAPDLSGKRKKVVFHRNPDAGGSPNAVYIGINGVTYGYQFEVPVDVPVEVLAVVDAAMTDKFHSNEKNEMIATPVKRFPYSMV